MSESRDILKQEFMDEEYRYAYAEDFLNTSIATQIRALRDLRQMSQQQLAERIGTKQAGISRLENVNYSAWKTETLRKIARALGVRLRVTFETFGTLLDESAQFSREALERPTFAALKEPTPHLEKSIEALVQELEQAKELLDAALKSVEQHNTLLGSRGLTIEGLEGELREAKERERQLREALTAGNGRTVMLFEQWWADDGRYIDPDTDDVPWFDKRKELAAIAYAAGQKSAESMKPKEQA